MCMPFTDVAQVANAARNYEILHERDDDDAERPDKRQKSGDRHQPTTQQSSHRNHCHNNDRHRSDRRGGSDNHCSCKNNYSGNNNRLNFRSIRSSSTHKHDPNITVFSSPGVPLRVTPTRSALRVDADTQESVVELLADKKPGASGSVFAITEDHATKTSVCTTYGRRHLGECRRATGTCFKCGQAGHLQKDCKKNTTEGTSGQADKKPGTTGRVFAITEGHATNTS
nr:hypothetical protein [Tanacetum cinerariifolium]